MGVIISMSYLRTGVRFGPRTDAALLFSPYMWLFRLLSWHLSAVRVLGGVSFRYCITMMYSDTQGLVEVTSSAILVLVSSNQFCFFSSL